MQCFVEESEDSLVCQIRISGDLSVRNAVALHQAVLAACEKHARVDICLHDITAFDVSAIQILMAAISDSTTQVIIRIRENAASVTHWLDLAGLSNILLNQAA